ncbi:3-hydroxyacyl-CoA dehydrogenase NAD-binding domain-containing protein [Mesorhizobium sp. M0902]|uniref:3-hydroxyacyl-CoA dehydrogenase NAD-binding domain-containing protein n=1 Tax=Mesorhizobium sp. M0902 TaxID=2957021 RepID=UPI003337C652
MQTDYTRALRVAPEAVKTVGLVGAGTIGAGWATHFLARGLTVIAVDPGPGAEERMRRKIAQAWPVMEKKGLADRASIDRLKFQQTPDGAFSDVDFVQESSPELLDIKKAVISDVSKAIRPDVVIASSASYLTATDIQQHCLNPARLVVGHPFHPVYLLPLVEVVGGQRTPPETVDWAMKFYAFWGHRPLHCRKEVLGHLGNRLQRALFAEALRLVADGVATTEEVDAAMTDAAGLRLGLFGPFMTRAMAGGDAGPRTVFEWQRTNKIAFPFERDNPELTNALVDDLVAGMVRQIDGRAIEDLEIVRDTYILELTKLREKAFAEASVDRDKVTHMVSNKGTHSGNNSLAP